MFSSIQFSDRSVVTGWVCCGGGGVQGCYKTGRQLKYKLYII